MVLFYWSDPLGIRLDCPCLKEILLADVLDCDQQGSVWYQNTPRTKTINDSSSERIHRTSQLCILNTIRIILGHLLWSKSTNTRYLSSNCVIKLSPNDYIFTFNRRSHLFLSNRWKIIYLFRFLRAFIPLSRVEIIHNNIPNKQKFNINCTDNCDSLWNIVRLFYFLSTIF